MASLMRWTMVGLFSAAASGCGPSSSGEGEGGGGGSGTGTTESDSTANASHSDTGSAEGSGSATGPTGTADDSDTNDPTASDASSDGMSTTGSILCPPLVEMVCEAVESRKVGPDDVVDCGNLTLTDTDPQLWADAQACVLDGAASGSAFKLVFQIPGIDSQPSGAFGGLVGFAYQMVAYSRDEGGVIPGSTTSRTDCSIIQATPDCTPDVGQPCLLCIVVEGTETQICESSD